MNDIFRSSCSFAVVLQNRCSKKFCYVLRNTTLLESLFNEVAMFCENVVKSCKIFCKYCEILRTPFFNRTSSVAASVCCSSIFANDLPILK